MRECIGSTRGLLCEDLTHRQTLGIDERRGEKAAALWHLKEYGALAPS